MLKRAKVMEGGIFVGFFFSYLVVSTGRRLPHEEIKSSDLLAEEFFSVEPQIFENKILKAIYKLKDFLKKGDAENEILPLDPYFLSYQSFDFFIEDTTLNGFFENVTIANFSNFIPQKIEFKLLPLHFQIDVFLDKLYIFGNYKLVGSILDEIPVNGTGKFVSETENLTLTLYVRPQNVNSRLQIKDLLFDYKVAKEKINYTNELDDGESQILDEKFALYILEKVREKYLPSLVNMGKVLLNHFLLGFSYQEILRIILEFFKEN